MAQTEEEAFNAVREGEVLAPVQAPALVSDPGLIGGLTRAEIDIQITTARANPRSIARAIRNIDTLATQDAESAMSCVFRLPQKVKDPVTGRMVDGFIEGPSARFAEIVASQWGNCRTASRQSGMTDKEVEATGIFHDLESNYALAKSVRRSIVGQGGARYGDRMVTMTANAAASIALRNAILAGIPKAVWGGAYRRAYEVGKGDAKTLVERRKKMLEMFAEEGVGQALVFELLNVKGLEDISVEIMHAGAGYFSAIRDGDTTLDELLAARRGPAPERGDLGAAFGKKGGEDPKPEGSKSPPKARAQRADAPKNTLASATNASKDSREESSGHAQQESSLSAGAEGPTTQEFIDPKTGIVYPTMEARLAAEKGEGEQRREESEGSKSQATSVGPQMDDAETHEDQEGARPSPGGAKGQAATEDNSAFSDQDDIAFSAFKEKLAGADSWLSIKPMVATLRASDAFDRASESVRKGILRLALNRVRELNDPVTPGTDVAFYRLYLLSEPEVEDADRHFRTLVRSPEWSKLSEGQKAVVDDENDALGVNQ